MPFHHSLVTACALLALVPVSRSNDMTSHPIFIGTYTRDGSKGIYSVRLNGSTGELSAPTLAAETKGPSYLALSPNRERLYAVSESEAMAAAFAVGADRTSLKSLSESQSAGGKAPCHLAVDHTGRVLIIANYHTGIVASLPINPDGSLQNPKSVIQHTGSSVNPERQSSPHAHSVTVSPDNQFVLACDLGVDKIFAYRLDPDTATLTPTTPAFTPTKPGAGPRHFAFSTDGRFAFMIAEMGGTLTAYHYDTATGALVEADVKSTVPSDFHGQNTTAAVRVHPNGRFVYGSNRGHDSIAVFAFDETKGQLSLIQIIPSGGKGPRDFALSPDGRWLVAAHQYSDSLTVFRVDPATGRLTPTPHTAKISTPVCVLFADK